jgi:transposase
MILVQSPVEAVMPRRYPPEFRRKVLDLVAAGRPVAQVAADLQISDQVIYLWRRQHLIDTDQLPGITSSLRARRGGSDRLAPPRKESLSHRGLLDPSGELL